MGLPVTPWIQAAPRSSGTPKEVSVWMRPPTRSRASMTVTVRPAARNACAARNPAMPAPTTTTDCASGTTSSSRRAARWPARYAPCTVAG